MRVAKASLDSQEVLDIQVLKVALDCLVLMASVEGLDNLEEMGSQVCKVKRENQERRGFHPLNLDPREKGGSQAIQVVVDFLALRDQLDQEGPLEGLAPLDSREILDHLAWMV